MVESQLPKNDAEKPAAATDRQHKTDSALDAFIKLRLAAFFQSAFGRYQERYGAQQKKWCKDYIVRPILFARRYYDSHSRCIMLTALAVGACIFLRQWATGRLESNTVIAIFTIVLTYATWYSWQAMRQQNRIMRRQMKQTDKIVKQMKLENRAWLAIAETKIRMLSPGYKKVLCTITVKNSGKTPGRIYSGLIKHYPRPANYPQELVINEFESQPSAAQVHKVNPGEGIIIEMDALGELDDATIDDIRHGRQQLHILVRFGYRDIADEPHEEKAFFTLIAIGPDMRRRANYCGIY